MPPSASLPMERTANGLRARCSRRARRGLAVLAATALLPQPCFAQKARLTGLSDVSFGMVTNLQVDSRQSQSVCVYSSSGTSGYSVSAWGSGAGGSFELTSGTSLLPYEVQWSDSSGQTSGTSLAPNVALTGQVSAANHQFCNSGPPASASLTVVLRAGDLSQAREGAYNGSLTLLIAAD